MPLADVEVGASVTILRFENEAEDLLHYLKATGIEPGMEGTLAERERRRGRRRGAGGRTITVDGSVAETGRVVADPSPPPRVALPEQLVTRGRSATGAEPYAAAGVPLSELYASARRAMPSSIWSGVTPE